MRPILFVFLLLISPCTFADTINLTWDSVTVDTSGNEITPTGYKVYVSQSSGVYTTPTASTALPSQTLNMTTLGKYYVVVTAFNAAGESAYSNEITFTVVAKKPAIPQNLKIVP